MDRPYLGAAEEEKRERRGACRSGLHFRIPYNFLCHFCLEADILKFQNDMIQQLHSKIDQ